LNGDIEKINETVDQENENITNKSAIIEKHKKARDSLNEQHNELKLKRNKAGDRRKELWRQQSEIETELVEAKEGMITIVIMLGHCINILAMTKAERQLYGSLPKEQQQAIEAIKRMKQDPSYGLKGVYAPVIELFTCTEKEMTAIEVAAKSSLFHVIVDTDTTAHKVLQLYVIKKSYTVT
jgi:structural maintenance of chromosome 3 (chondroitin sulfate proteoglycan 6)